MSIQSESAEKARKDAEEWAEVEQLAALYDKNKGDENDYEVTLAYDMVSEKLMKDRFVKMEKLINAREQAVKNLHRANLEYEKNYQGEKKNYVVENLLEAMHEYDAAQSALNAAQ